MKKVEIDGEIYDKPTDRSECRGTVRPCPWVSCRYHLLLEYSDKFFTSTKGDYQIKSSSLDDPGLDEEAERLLSMPYTCSLDAADAGPAVLRDVGLAMNITRERVRQLEEIGFRKVRREAFLMGVGKVSDLFLDDSADDSHRRLPPAEVPKNDSHLGVSGVRVTPSDKIFEYVDGFAHLSERWCKEVCGLKSLVSNAPEQEDSCDHGLMKRIADVRDGLKEARDKKERLKDPTYRFDLIRVSIKKYLQSEYCINIDEVTHDECGITAYIAALFLFSILSGLTCTTDGRIEFKMPHKAWLKLKHEYIAARRSESFYDFFLDFKDLWISDFDGSVVLSSLSIFDFDERIHGFFERAKYSA